MEPALSVDVDAINDAIKMELNKQILTEIQDDPTSRILNLENLTVEQITEFFASLHSVTFGQFTITSKDTGEVAAKWLLHQIDKLYEFVTTQAVEVQR